MRDRERTENRICEKYSRIKNVRKRVLVRTVHPSYSPTISLEGERNHTTVILCDGRQRKREREKERDRDKENITCKNFWFRGS